MHGPNKKSTVYVNWLRIKMLSLCSACCMYARQYNKWYFWYVAIVRLLLSSLVPFICLPRQNAAYSSGPNDFKTTRLTFKSEMQIVNQKVLYNKILTNVSIEHFSEINYQLCAALTFIRLDWVKKKGEWDSERDSERAKIQYDWLQKSTDHRVIVCEYAIHTAQTQICR